MKRLAIRLPVTPGPSPVNAREREVRRRAMVLLAVLVVIVVLALAGYQYSDLMSTEYRASHAAMRDLQARSCAESGVHFAAAMLSSPQTAGDLFDNPELFQGHIVLADSATLGQGRFSVVAPPLDAAGAAGNQSFRFGMSDESAKINLNAILKMDRSGKIAHDMLMKLPNMSEDIVNGILDWIDKDSDPRSSGAENETYGTMPIPYRVKNGPPDSFEELLLVRGITPQLLFGDDRNRNGLLDSGESQPPGWASYLTVYSREMNLDSSGAPRINLNEKDLESLYSKLSPAVGDDLAKFIILARQHGLTGKSKEDSSNKGGNSSGGSSGGKDSSGGGKSGGGGGKNGGGSGGNNGGSSGGKSGSSGGGSSGSKGGGSLRGLSGGSMGFGKKQGDSKRFSSIYDLIDAQVSVPSEEKDAEPTVYSSPLTAGNGLQQHLPLLLDKTTTLNKAEMAARINVNTAPDAVLSALPELTASEVQAVISARPQPGQNDGPSTIAWMSTDAKIPAATMKKLERYITASSQVYRLQSVGYFDEGGPVIRIEAVIDANAGRPRVLYWRDLSELGRGYEVTGAQ